MIVPDKHLSAVVPLFIQNDGICLLAGIINIMLLPMNLLQPALLKNCDKPHQYLYINQKPILFVYV
ncbi:hypothetical protein D3G91_17725 [Escherichia coli]|nr:hypothetical protein [Escherichia coli]EFD0843970.1 hypothetical protein [Escherichia coli]EFN9874788.1 hypothetical protein [Escherichia coli]MXE67577.1 hypothetical protein [Escherichia coli]TDH46119.1 hypothetical protein E1N53_07720 [Escherichia coli]